MKIRSATPADAAPWAQMRAALWPVETVEEHRQEVLATLASGDRDAVAFLAFDGEGRPCGFAEAALRRDYVNGCDTSPVVFLEGIYTRPEARAAGVGRALCAAVEAWGRDQGCTEFAADALLDNLDSHAFHAALGFEETERVVYFRKAL